MSCLIIIKSSSFISMSTKEITQIVVVTVKCHTIQDRGEQNILILTVKIVILFYQYVLTVEVSSHPLTPKISSVVLLTVYHKNSHDVSSKSPI